MASNLADYFAQHLAAPSKVLYRHFGSDGWADVTVAEVAALAGRWQLAFKSLGLGAGARIGICAKNGVDWVALDLAALGRRLAPTVAEVAHDYAGKLKVTKLNVDEAMNSAGRYNIRGIPTLLVFKNG